MELTETFFLFVLLGLIAQLVDGALGMAYGLLCSTVLLGLGLPPATVSAAVHGAEVFTTGVSGGAHALFGNVDRRLFIRLAIPGMIGGASGAYFLSKLPGDTIKPFILVYLLVLALFILFRALKHWVPKHDVRHVPLLGLVAGTLDAIGGGGWGPIATSTLLARGNPARTTIGSVNAAEFVVTAAISLSFIINLGISHIEIVAGLLVGGVIAAPLAAYLVKRVPERGLLVAVGTLIMSLAGYQLWDTFGRAA